MASSQGAMFLVLLLIGLRAAVQHVREAAVQPGFAGHIVMAAVHKFIEHVRAVTPEATHLLLKAIASLGHEILIALIPQLASVNESARHSAARRFHDALLHRFCIKRRQVAVPIDDFTFLSINGLCAATHDYASILSIPPNGAPQSGFAQFANMPAHLAEAD
ncbi:MAG TPA: hypothetical protein VEU11_14270 [Terriglobales bacterium]|nr:hypothetical protein [Terriglobales bacterium]